MRSTPLLRSALPLVVMLLAGCPHRIAFGPEGQITDPNVLMRQLDQRAARVVSLKAEARVRVRTPEQSGTVTEFIAALRPAALHLETLNFFGKPVGVLVSDGTQFALFLEENGTYYTGPASPANVSRLLPLTLEPREAVMLVLGEVPRIPAEQATLELDEKERAYRLTLKSGGITQTIWVGTEDLRPLKSEVRGAATYDLKLGKYEAFKGVLFPMKVEIVTVDAKGEPSGTEIAISYNEDTEVNPEVDLSLFTLRQPPNSKLVELDALGREKGESAPVPKPELPLTPTPDQEPPQGSPQP